MTRVRRRGSRVSYNAMSLETTEGRSRKAGRWARAERLDGMVGERCDAEHRTATGGSQGNGELLPAMPPHAILAQQRDHIVRGHDDREPGAVCERMAVEIDVLIRVILDRRADEARCHADDLGGTGQIDRTTAVTVVHFDIGQIAVGDIY